MTAKNSDKQKRFENWRDYSMDSINYAVERFDLLIIAIATTGIIIDLNIIKASFEINISMDSWVKLVIKLSIISFAGSILFNFLSQLHAKKAFNHERLWSQEILYEIEGTQFDEIEIENHRKQADQMHRKTRRANKLSTIFLGFGFLLLAGVILFIV